jgi:hypothetical protein
MATKIPIGKTLPQEHQPEVVSFFFRVAFPIFGNPEENFNL